MASGHYRILHHRNIKIMAVARAAVNASLPAAGDGVLVGRDVLDI